MIQPIGFGLANVVFVVRREVSHLVLSLHAVDSLVRFVDEDDVPRSRGLAIRECLLTSQIVL